MPRSRKVIDMQKGNLTVSQQITRKAEEESVTAGRSRLKRPPVWLTDEAAIKEYKRIVKDLDKIGIVGNLDINNIAAYCNAYTNYLKATDELSGQPLCIERETRNGTMVVRNPLIDIQTNYANEMRKFASLCGLTIDSRLKAAAEKTTKTEDTISQKFGSI